MGIPEANPKENKDCAKRVLLNVLETIVKGEELIVVADYDPPVYYKLHPMSFKPVKHSVFGTKLDLCIGRKITDDEVMPDVCIDIYQNTTSSNLSNASSRMNSLKSIWPHVQYGLLDFSASKLNKELLNHNQRNYITSIDFIYALGDIIEHPDKLEHHLQDFIIEQVSNAGKYARVLYENEGLLFVKSISFS